MNPTDLYKQAPKIARYAPVALELTIIAVFLYAGYLVNTAFNPTIDSESVITKGRVIFDKTAISAVKKLNEPLVITESPVENANLFGQQ